MDELYDRTTRSSTAPAPPVYTIAAYAHGKLPDQLESKLDIPELAARRVFSSLCSRCIAVSIAGSIFWTTSSLLLETYAAGPGRKPTPATWISRLEHRRFSHRLTDRNIPFPLPIYHTQSDKTISRRLCAVVDRKRDNQIGRVNKK